jgi:hypothetical protein
MQQWLILGVRKLIVMSQPALLSSNETWVNLGIKSQKSAYLNQLNVSKPLVTSNLQKCEDLRPYIIV